MANVPYHRDNPASLQSSLKLFLCSGPPTSRFRIECPAIVFDLILGTGTWFQ